MAVLLPDECITLIMLDDDACQCCGLPFVCMCAALRDTLRVEKLGEKRLCVRICICICADLHSAHPWSLYVSVGKVFKFVVAAAQVQCRRRIEVA